MFTPTAPYEAPAATDPRTDVAGPTDRVLMHRLADGSHDALARLYDRHVDAVFAAAMRVSRDRSIAADVVQETFLTLWNRAELFDPARGTLPAWLARIARNRAIDHLRAAGRHDRAASFSTFGLADDEDAATIDWLTSSGEPVASASPEVGPERALADKEVRSSVRTALDSLDPVERHVIVLAYEAGLSQSEIAARTGWPIGTVKTRTRRALRHLRDRLENSQPVSARAS
jgi:RNA polymerase sigma-70 factor (ECF subfamily)